VRAITTRADGHGQRVVKLVQELLLDVEDRSSITPAVISQKIDLVVSINPVWSGGLDRTAIIDELIRRFSVWIGQDTTLMSEVGHQPWLSAGRKRDWRYWQRYREWLERTLSWKAIESLDQSTDSVLSLLEDPLRNGPWDRRGLVVGHVQSGKTANYTALICKAADAGYKIIIVLAGLHNNLRSQTQMRLDEGFLGYETKPTPDDMSIVGVGEIDADPSIRPNYATNRSEKGDFNTTAARNLGITPEQRPWLFVVKKNKTVLERLHQWIRNHVSNAQDTVTGRKIVTHLPLLLIDDEADHASVDTGEQVFDADGNPDEEHAPTAINSRIRKILHSFTRSAYVGYTATPFANIFIHERGETREEGPDLFPSAFIINLAAPSDYVGPITVFGAGSTEGRQEGLPLVRLISDASTEDGRAGWMPHRHANGHVPLHDGADALPPSMIEAIDAFVLACAARRVRGQEKEHSSMLVHVTRFNSVQREVHRQIEEHLRRLRQRIVRHVDHAQILERLHVLWEKDFRPTSEVVRLRRDEPVRSTLPSWDGIMAALADTISDIEVRMINGTARDVLDYAEHAATGLKVIAVGGDKLARGLTLEGLCISYFLRASRMYDTLMQMGRWFGYRPGYLDLCRLYTTVELREWFGHIADAAEELREEFDLMAASGATPREYGLKVQSHPVLMVTSRLKMRTARNLMLSFSGQLLETVALYRDPSILADNLDTTRRLLSALGAPELDPTRTRGERPQQWTGFLWAGVGASTIVEFLFDYRTHPEAYKVNSVLLAQFIESMTHAGELTQWTVALIGGGEGAECQIVDGIKVNMLRRTHRGPLDGRYSIGRLLSPRDETIDLDSAAWEAALAATRDAWRADPARLRNTEEPQVPNGPAIRKVRGFGADGVMAHPECGLLLLYVLDPQKADAGFPPNTPPVIAVGVSFPGSRSGLKVEYKVNNVLWEQEYGAAE
jgi:hypothetical protein